jgi:hypothetical protein
VQPEIDQHDQRYHQFNPERNASKMHIQLFGIQTERIQKRVYTMVVIMYMVCSRTDP